MKIGLSAEYRTGSLVSFRSESRAVETPPRKSAGILTRGVIVVKLSPDDPRKSTHPTFGTFRLPSTRDCTPPLTGGQEKMKARSTPPGDLTAPSDAPRTRSRTRQNGDFTLRSD